MVKEEKAEKKEKARQKPARAAKEAPKETQAAEAKREEKKAETGKPETRKEEAAKAEAPVKAEAKAAPKAKRKAPAKKPPARAFVARGKRKESIARATIRAGKGVIRINSQNLSAINNPYIREIIREPLRYVGPEANNIDISVNVEGGGAMGQAQAARTAIANALSLYFDQMNLREKFIGIDRSLVIEDTRRVEPKKFRGPKARARFQKSYR
jgi:small subunit ribosomal protein S9